MSYAFLSPTVIGAEGYMALFYRAQSWEFFDFFVPIMIALICVEALYSYFHERNLYEFNDTIMSMSHGILTDLIVQRMFIPSLDLLVQCWIYYHYAIFRFKSSWWIHLVAFFAIDFCYYWLHRAAHEVNLIWATHQVHHSSERYNLSTATRQGIFQNFFAWMIYIPLAFFVPPTVFWVHKQVNTLYQFWIHTQVVGNLGPFLEFWLNTPSHHRAHHARNAKYLDKNYGGVLIIWDRMFGTFEPESEVVVYGLVHPDTYFDLFKAQFGHYIHIFTRYLSYSSIVDKLSVVFFGPGWMPGTKRLGDPVPEELCPRVPDGSPSPQPTYNPKIQDELSTYLLVHTVLLFALIIVINPAIEGKSNLDVTLVVYSVIGLYQLSTIFQSGFAAFLPLEVARILFYVLLEVGCFIHDLLNNRTHGLWWSASEAALSRFSYFDHSILAISLISHCFSIGFILFHWDRIWTECCHTQGPPPNISIKRLVMPLTSKLGSASSSLDIEIKNTKKGKKSLPPTPRSPKGAAHNKSNASPEAVLKATGRTSKTTTPRNKNNEMNAEPLHHMENTATTGNKIHHHQVLALPLHQTEPTAREKLTSTHTPRSPKGTKVKRTSAKRD